MFKKNYSKMLYDAICDSDLNKAKKAIAMGAISEPDYNGQPALIRAVCWNRDISFFHLLLDNGADINVYNQRGETALMESAERGYNNIVKELLAKGADINLENKQGYTALMLAQKNNHLPVVKILEEHAEKLNPKSAAQSAINSPATESWQKMGEDRLLFTGIYPDQGKKLTEIFNFATRTQITAMEELESGSVKFSSQISFRELDKQVIETLFNQFAALGGKADKDFIVHGNSLSKNAPPNKF